MAVRTRIDPIARDIELMIAADLSPEAQSEVLADFARVQLMAAQDTNNKALGRTPPHETYVDGQEGAPLDSVRPQGVIAFEFQLLDEVFGWIAEQLKKNSPIKSGDFQNSFLFLADGTEASVAAPPAASEYVFINTQPYARKIEKGLSKQAPDGVMEAVAALASQRFGNIARISFGFRSLLMDYVPVHRASARRGRKKATPAHRAAHNLSKQSRQPAIWVRI
jgi:hypothetical protein